MYAADGVTQAWVDSRGDAVVMASEFNRMHAEYRAMRRALSAMRSATALYIPQDPEAEAALEAAKAKADHILCPDPAGERIRIARQGNVSMEAAVKRLATEMGDASFGPLASAEASMFWQFEEESLQAFAQAVRKLEAEK